MTSLLSPAQLGLLRQALQPENEPITEGDPRDLAVLTRAGLLRKGADGQYVATDTGRRYFESVAGKSAQD